MKLIDLSIREFIHDVDSPSPAPGGGSVSAVASALGVALLRMVGHLTIPKKKFQKLDDSVQREFIDNHESLKSLQNKLLELVDRDTEAFNEIMEAFRLPKETESEQKKRVKAIEQATIKAIDVPMSIAEIAYKALKKVDFVRQHGNKNAISDVGVSALMLYAGLEGACLNVKINLPGVSDVKMKDETLQKTEAMIRDAKAMKEQLVSAIHEKLGN